MTESRSVRWLICAFGLALNLSISATLIVAAILLVEWGVRSLRSPSRGAWRASPLDVPLAIFFLWKLFTAFVCKSTPFFDAISSQSAMLLFFWAAHAIDEEETKLLFRWFCVGAVIAGLMGLIQRVDGVNYLPSEDTYIVPPALSKWPQWIVHELALRNDRAVGPRNHPLTYAETFIPSFFFLMSWVLAEVRSERKSFRALAWPLLGLAVVIGGVLVATGRAVWLGLAIGVLVFAWSVGRKFFIRFVLIGLIVGVPVVALGPAGIRGRLMSIVSTKSGSEGDQQSKATRYTLWTQSLQLIKEHPLVGVGFKGARLKSIDPISGLERTWTETHNMFLQEALELGVVGLGIFIWVLIVIMQMINGLSADWRPLFWGMFFTFMIAGLTETWPRDKEVAMIFWLFMGSAELLRQHAPRR